jgi:hypothetical protein
MSAWKTLLLLVGGVAAANAAQVPPPAVVVDPVKADFLAKTGSDVVYFAGTGHVLDASARTPRRNGCSSIPQSGSGSKAIRTSPTPATMRWRSACDAPIRFVISCF